MKLFRRTRGLTLIGLWAFAPPVFVQSNGRGGFDVSVGASAGQYEVVIRNCAGDFVSSRGVPARTGGAVVEFELSESPFRFAGFGGWTSVSGEDFDQGGAYAGALVAYEGGRIGLGAGPVLLPGDQLPPNFGNQVVPSLYLRIGDREGGFFQTDAFAPSPIPTATGLIRGGIGFNGARVSGFAGISTFRALDLSDGDNGGPFLELKLPLGRSLDGLIGGSYFISEEQADWGAGVGLRYRFGTGP